MFGLVLSTQHIENVSWLDSHSSIRMTESSMGQVTQWDFTPLELLSQCVTISSYGRPVKRQTVIGNGVLICYLVTILLLLTIKLLRNIRIYSESEIFPSL